MSPAMDAAVRVYKPVGGLSEGEDDSTSIAIAGAAVESGKQCKYLYHMRRILLGLVGQILLTYGGLVEPFLQYKKVEDGIEKIITSIRESNTTDQLFYEAETSHGPSWLIRRHVKPANNKDKNIVVYEDKFVQQLILEIKEELAAEMEEN